MKLTPLIIAFAVSPFFAGTSMSQEEYEDSYYDENEAIGLNDFPSCQLVPQGDCQARVTCTGEADILFLNSKGVRSATKRAYADARAKYAEFYNNQVAAAEAIEEATRERQSQTQNGEGEASMDYESIQTSIFGSNSEMMIKGLQTIGRNINKEEKLVQVIVGASCKSRRAVGDNSAPSESTDDDSAEQKNSSQTDDGSVRTKRSRSKNADNF